jgi:alkylated DNA repair dioxygenase AlkB
LQTQPSLFGHETPAVPVLDDGVTRLELGSGAWVDHAPEWLVGHQALFAELLTGVDWKHHRRPMYDRYVDVPRLMGAVPSVGTAPSVVAAVQARLLERYQIGFERVSVALYRDGADSVTWHGDQVARELPQAYVVTISLGEPRNFALRPKGGGLRHDFRLGHGDLVVMGGTCQRTWEHCVPKVSCAGPRIALMFRPEAMSSQSMSSQPVRPPLVEQPASR